MKPIVTIIAPPSILNNAISRVDFDAENPDHRSAYAEYLFTKKWVIQFNLEQPNTTVFGTAMFKMAEYACKKELEGFKRRAEIAERHGQN